MGTFIKQDNFGHKQGEILQLSKDGFSITTASRGHLAVYTCCDTIAIGKWELDNSHGLISLSTPDFSNRGINLEVTEELNYSQDSVYIFISSPIERES